MYRARRSLPVKRGVLLRLSVDVCSPGIQLGFG
jgi:hypothetical protein